MGNFREKFQRFMHGRYGNDKFNMFLMIAALVFLVVSWFTNKLFYLIALALILYSYFRMLSRNYGKRASENQKYLAFTFRIRNAFNRYKRMWYQRKSFKFFKCPSCRQQVRVPKGHGQVEITCPKCKMVFRRRT